MEAPRGDAGLRVAALAAAVLAGCGGGALSEDEYRERFRAAVDRATSAASPKLQTPSRLADPDQPARSIEQVGSSFVRLRDELKPLTPPREVAGAHRDFVSAIGGLSSGFREYARVVRSGDREAISRGAPRFFDRATIRKLERATRAFEKRGYRVRPSRGVRPP